MLARLLLLILMLVTLPPALLAKDLPKPIEVRLSPPSAGAKFLVTQVETINIRQNDRQTVLSERYSDYDLEVLSSGVEGWLVSLMRKQVTWKSSDAKAVSHIAIMHALESAFADAEIGISRRIRFSPSGKAIGLPDGEKFRAAVLTALPRGLDRFLLSPDLVRVFGGEQAAVGFVQQVHERARQNLPGKEPDLLGTWLQHTLAFPYEVSIQIGKPVKLDAPLKTIRVIAPTASETTVTVTQDAIDPKTLMARFKTVYDTEELTERTLRDQTRRVQAISSRRVKAAPEKQADYEAWANELISRLKSRLSSSRIDRATLVINRETGWPVSFEAQNVESFQGLTEKMVTTNNVVSQVVEVRFKRQ
ncbi:MAG: hypothetical protein JXQ99_15915 [Hyphomicrobiaceae bacterium]